MHAIPESHEAAHHDEAQAELSSAAKKWKGAGKAVVMANRLSNRLTTLRDQLGQNSFVDWQDLEELRVLGKGSFATVTKCSYRPPGGGPPQLVAVKVVRTELLNDPRQTAMFIEEVKLLRKLKHKYIVAFYGCGWSKETEEDECGKGSGQHGQAGPPDHQLFFVQEYLEGGTLQAMVFEAMEDEDWDAYSDRDALRWALQIAMALEFLHTRTPKIIHRDLKLENILLSSLKPAKADAKLADFGLARRLTKSNDRSVKSRRQLEKLASMKPEELDPATRAASADLDRKLSSYLTKRLPRGTEKSYHAAVMTARAGSMGYMAPEVLQGKPYNEKADVFSFAIVMYNLFHRDIPTARILLHGNLKDLELYAQKVAHGARPEMNAKVPEQVRDLIRRCWQKHPELRPSMSEVVAELEKMQPPPGEEGASAQGGCCSVM